MRAATSHPAIAVGRVRMSAIGSVTGVVLAMLASAGPGAAASVQNISPPSGAALIEGPVTLRWDLDVAGCDPNKTAVTQVELEIDGQLAPAALPEPAATGLNAGLFAAAAADGFRFAVEAVNVRTDGAPSVYRWRAILDCTGPGIPPDPTAVPIHIEGPWSEFRVTRVRSGTPSTPVTPGGGTPAGTVPRTLRPTPFGPRRARIVRFLGWASRNRPMPTPFTVRQIPRPLTPAGGTMRNCRSGPRGILLVFRYAAIPRPRPISWTWTLDGTRLVTGSGSIGGRGNTLYQVWLGSRSRVVPNGVFTVSLRVGSRLFGSASVRRAC